jgi:hypothetical protein
MVAAGFALLGPVVLAVWWFAGSSVGAFARLPGFFSQWAPTIGDALLLTTLAALVRSAYRDLAALRASEGFDENTRPGFSGPMWALGPFAGAAVVVVAVHAQWLSNPAIVPNWTLPRAGTLAAPGVLHAVFVTLLLYWMLAFATRAVIVTTGIAMHRLKADSWGHFELLREKATACAMLAVAFASLLYVDNYGYAFSLDVLARSWSTVAVLVASVGLVAGCSLWFGWLARRASAKMPDDVRERARTAAVVPLLVIVCAPAVVGLTWIAGRLVPWPLISGAAGILGIVVVGAAWFDVYGLSLRTMTPAGAVVLAVAWLAAECGYLGAVLVAVSVDVSVDRFTSLPTLLWMAPAASLLGAGACLALLLWLLKREHAIKDRDLTRESASGNLVQNAAQYWGMLQLVVLPVAFLAGGRIVSHGAVRPLQDLLLSGIGPNAYVTLMFGYFGVVTFGLGFALNNSWQHVGMLEREKDPSTRHVRRAILFMSLGVAIVAGIAFYSMWIGALASFIGMAKI